MVPGSCTGISGTAFPRQRDSTCLTLRLEVQQPLPGRRIRAGSPRGGTRSSTIGRLTELTAVAMVPAGLRGGRHCAGAPSRRRDMWVTPNDFAFALSFFVTLFSVLNP